MNARWYGAGGAPPARRCPVCAEEVASADYVVHYGGELYHCDCDWQQSP